MQFGTIAVAIVLGVLVLVVQHSLRRGLTVVVAALIARQLADFAKDVWDRPRPGVAYPDLVPRLFEAGWGFPSAHAAVAAAVAIAIGAGTSRRWWPLLVALVVAVACARVYFGVHFVLDVLGGLALGTTVGALVVGAERRLVRQFASARSA
jgi:undecaprenyl-diphosphatase